MRFIIKILSVIFLFVFFGLYLSRPAFAEAFTLSGRVSDNSSNPITNATIDVIDTNSNTNVASTTTDSGENYTTIITGGTYNVQVAPPAGSSFSPAIALGQNISSNTVLNFILTPIGTVTLSGHVYDPLGNPVPSQKVYLRAADNTQTTATTDTIGSYSLQVSSGTYNFYIEGSNNDLSLNVPQNYQILKTNYVLTQSTLLEITIPAKKVNFHVQDSLGNPVSNIKVDARPPSLVNNQSLSIGGGITDASANQSYTLSGPTTDTTGDTNLWVLPNSSSLFYNFIATPPSGSIYVQFTLNNISIAADETELISLQYNHTTPTTTVDLVTEHADGTYSEPTTVTLSATAASGYSIANIYYKVDGGSQQTYSSSFSVSGMGDHHIEYWSVDNSGVQEIHKTKDFTIYINQAPYVDPFPNVEINQGQTYTENGSFTDNDSTYWTATVDYDEGAGPENLPLNPDKTFSLSHQYATAGEYTVTVVVRDNQQATGTTMATVTVNGIPQIGALSGASINQGQTYTENGSFTDSDSSSWTATVDYDDGDGPVNLPLNPDKTFNLNHTYFATGTYTVTVNITDNQGATGTDTITVTVNGPPHISQLLGATITEGQTYTENGSFTDPDSTSWIATVDYDEGASQEPLPLNPDKTFTLNNLYEQNGTYTVTVVITDNQGAFDTKTAEITVNNEAPTVGTVTLTPNPVQINTSITATATYTDPGVLDTHTATANWGDGNTNAACLVNQTTNTATCTYPNGGYQAANVYPVTITISDESSSGTSPESYASVYSPTQGSIFSAGQRFNNPATASPATNGNVIFGLNYKYQGGMPEGVRQFSMDFNAANIHFNATTVSSLVISGTRATLKGSGTLNDTGTYNFLVVGVDGNGIRIKIYDPNNNNAVIYDSQNGASDTATPTTSVTGQVIVH